MKKINKNIAFILVMLTLLAINGPTHANLAATLSNSTDEVTDEDNSQSPDLESVNLKISEKLPIEEAVEKSKDTFSFITNNLGFTQTTMGRILGSVVIVSLATLLILLAKKIAHILECKYDKISKRIYLNQTKIGFYKKSLTYISTFLITIGSISSLNIIWDLPLDAYISESFIALLIQQILSLAIILVGGSILTDLVSGVIEKGFKRWGRASQSRIETLLPIAQNIVSAFLATILTLMFLSELGINVIPLLAGAGVIGIAVGFGAQAIIKDLLTGFIIILEDLIQVGDVVTLSGKTGAIEKITIRKVQLRDLEGVVYTIPFSEVSIVENRTKNFSYAMFEVGVAYKENTDKVNNVLRTICSEMMEDPEFKAVILEPIEILGLDQFADSAVIIKARIKTEPSEQWRVMREFNRRMKYLFDEKNIEIPFPHRTLYFADNMLPIKGKVNNGVSNCDEYASHEHSYAG